MLLAPRRTKYRKQFRGVFRRLAIKGNNLNYGKFGLKSMESYWITDRHLEAVRVILARETRKVGRYWIRIFPHKPYTKKPAEVTMGSGKGEVSHYVSSVVAGTIMFELDGVTLEEAKMIFRKATSKLPIPTKLIERDHE